MINNTCPQSSLFSSSADQLNPMRPLYLLADKIDWRRFETSFSPLYSADNGHPAKPIRLMCGLLILKHVRNLSDESVVEQLSGNAYYQYFCGMLEFTPSYPCNASELVYFRKRIDGKGVELILSKASVSTGRMAAVATTTRPSSTPPCRKRTWLTPRTRSCIKRLSAKCCPS